MAVLVTFLLTAGLQDADTKRNVLDLIERLGSDRADERDRATTALKGLGDAALPELRRAARERDGEIRARAGALVHWFDVQKLLSPRLKELFPDLEQDLLERKPEAWRSVFRSVKEDHDPGYDDLTPRDLGLIYEKSLGEAESDRERAEILQAAAARPGPIDSARIAPLLDAPDPKMRALAAMAAGRTESKGSLDRLRTRLEDAEWEVRARAAEALGRLNARDAMQDLIRILDHPPDVVGAAAATALGRIGNREAEPALRALLRKPGVLRAAAAHALADLGAEDGLFLLGKVVEEEAFDLKLPAAERLGRLAPKALPALRSCLKHPDANARALAVEALAKGRFEEAVPDVAALLADGAPAVRRSAAEALADLGARDRGTALVKLLSDPEDAVRQTAAESLGRLGVKDAIPDLRKALKDPAAFTQFAAASALCVLGDDAGVPLLLRESKRYYDAVQEAVSLTALNALRQPTLWTRLASTPLESGVEGRTPVVLQRISDAAGLKVELGEPDPQLDEASDPWLQRRHSIPGKRKSVLEAITSLRGKGACDFILEGATLRVVPHSEAMKFWADWQEARGRK